MTEHLFDSSGQFIAFRRDATDNYVFTADGNQLGWLPYGDLDVHHHSSGRYLATIVGDRLLVMPNRPARGLPGLPGLPGIPGFPGIPGLRGIITLPARAKDLPKATTTQFQYLFDSSGAWIAFRIGQYVWDEDCEWVGWCPFNDEKVFTPDGDYLGSILENDRLAREVRTPRYSRVGRPGRPGRPGCPGRPGRLGRIMLPTGWQALRTG
ncbi:hypothetical protein DBP19_35180 [Streptomyces sp. CS090A]|uniref:4-fold beta flower protein n=1 Tax=Streptomyces sp. CS090A TaxID=2162710 RepID=UPI000D50BEA0|nr:hypothetical protein [Streptomyces sp. CS090A]PVC80749.1 hypothetical protein DBP19_35180 [Streptomyces sp. CS090A]